MPTGKVAVKGSFVEKAPEQLFADVPMDAYYYEAVKWAAGKSITGGIGNDLFASNQPCTRTQIVTLLFCAPQTWRMGGGTSPPPQLVENPLFEGKKFFFAGGVRGGGSPFVWNRMSAKSLR